MARAGGSYIREDGKLKLVERTQPQPKKQGADEKPAQTKKPTQREQE